MSHCSCVGDYCCKGCTTQLTDPDIQRLKQRIAELESQLKTSRERSKRLKKKRDQAREVLPGLIQALEQTCHILDSHTDPSARIAAISCRGFLPGAKAVLNER